MTAAVLRAVGEASLSAAVMILAVLALRLKFQDRTPRRVFCLLWDIVLVRLLVLGTLPSPLSIWRWLPAVAPQPTAVLQTQAPVVVGVEEGTLLTQEALVSQVEGITYLSADNLASGTAAQSLDWSVLLFGVWAAVLLLLAGGFLWSHLRSRKVYASSLPCRERFVLDWLAAHPLYRPVQARVSDQIAAPLTYGVLYPVILLPKSLAEDCEDRHCAFGPTTGPAVSQSATAYALACVLAHEHTHIRRFDALRKVFLAAVLCLHWFNPLVWAMYALCSRDIELACDEAVLRGGADRERYALALLSMEERRGGWSPSGSHFSGHALEERIKAIMKQKHISITALVAVLVVMSITTTVFASAAPENTQDPHENAPETGFVYDHLGLVEDNGVAILSKGGENGEKLYSTDDGKTWMSEDRYRAEYGSWGDDWEVEWWTYEDYKVWLEEEKAALQSVIGERAYTSTDGWFTWDQEKVDEAIALYEGILEEIKNGALYSKTITDKNGNSVEDVALGSNNPAGMVITSVFDETEEVVTADKAMDEAALLEELKAFGISGNANLMTYNGQLVRWFVDGASVGDNGYSIAYVYRNDEGTIDLHTLRAVIHNPDGSFDTMGELIGIAAKGDANFDPDLIGCALYGAGVQATTTDAIAEGGTSERGKTFEEVFAQYEEYGLTYRPREIGMGALTYDNQPVRSFADIKPDGGVFSYQDPCAQEGLTVRTEYGPDGKLLGLVADPQPVKDYSTVKQDLGFSYSAPVQGKVAAAFGWNNGKFHYGVDLAAEKGTDIAAFADGTVSEVGFSASLGNYVVLSHAGGYTTLYAHCSSIAVTEGSSAAMGEKIAEVGASGMAPGPVLHFELRDGETYLDPAAYLDLRV